MNRRWWCPLLLPLLGGCSHAGADRTVLEQAQARPLEFSVQAEGDLRSTKPTPLLVPGAQWTARQLNWMLPDGSTVAKGQLVARFSAEQSKQDLAQARIDLERNTLARAAKQAELDDKSGQLGVDHALAGEDLADRARQVLDRAVLDEEPARARLHGTAQVPGTAERRDDEDLAFRQFGVQFGGGVEPAAPGHLDVEDGDVRAYLAGRRHDPVARGDLADDLEVLLQVEQQGQSAAHHALVLGEQYLDQETSSFTGASPTGASSGSVTVRR